MLVEECALSGEEFAGDFCGVVGSEGGVELEYDASLPALCIGG